MFKAAQTITLVLLSADAGFCKRFVIALLFAFCVPHVHAATTVSSARVWPAEEYTRLTIEANTPPQYKFFIIKNPERLVLDLEDTELTAALEGLSSKVSSNDPYIKLVRVGRYKPGVVRLVLELKAEVKPSVFVLKPVGEYGDRLVLDIYPVHPVDPLMSLLQTPDAKTAAQGIPNASDQAAEPIDMADADNKQATPLIFNAEDSKIAKPEASDKKSAPDVVRLVTIAIDAGHGGEDPGAQGKRGTSEKNVTLAIARKLKQQVDDEPNMRGVLIRDGDYFIPLN